MGLRGKINNPKSFLLLFCLAAVCLTIVADAFLLRELKQSYADTKGIISGIAAEGYSGDEILIWLKELPEEAWLQAGEDRLHDYGYDSKTPTVWDEKYRSARTVILAASALFNIVLLMAFLTFARLYKNRDEARVNELEKLLRQLQDTDSDSLELTSDDIGSILESRLLSLQAQIQTDHARSEQEKEETKALVTDISHQLKTPVAALKTNLELLSSEELTENERREFLERAIRQLEGLENLTKALVNVSRMEKGMIQINVRPLPIRDAILSAINRLYEKASGKSISIELSTEEAFTDLPVLHDPKWTTEVFVNLLDNAIKYSPADTCITISLLNLTGFLRIDVEDEGSGIPPSEYHSIFKRFYRGPHTAGIEGSGVGLYLAREIVEKQNGILFVRSRNGGRPGSVFSVQLPKA